MAKKEITFTFKELKEIYNKALERLNNEMVLNHHLKYELATNTLLKHSGDYKHLESQLNAYFDLLDRTISNSEIDAINTKIDAITDKQVNMVFDLMNN